MDRAKILFQWIRQVYCLNEYGQDSVSVNMARSCFNEYDQDSVSANMARSWFSEHGQILFQRTWPRFWFSEHGQILIQRTWTDPVSANMDRSWFSEHGQILFQRTWTDSVSANMARSWFSNMDRSCFNKCGRRSDPKNMLILLKSWYNRCPEKKSIIIWKEVIMGWTIFLEAEQLALQDNTKRKTWERYKTVMFGVSIVFQRKSWSRTQHQTSKPGQK